ncbi:MAG: hypothetical protein P8Y70_12685 [Candidatus Lokiarchaeota archaeon]
MSKKPEVKEVIEEEGEISDELDFALMNYLLKNRGTGFTACQPKLVELETGKEVIKMGIDNTFINKDNQLMGLGIIGTIFVDPDTLDVLYATPKEELSENIEKLRNAGVEPQQRPKGKY